MALIEADVGTPDRSQSAYQTFQEGPLSVEGCEYVLKSDIASYYQYIDHELLVNEVVAQTGDDLAVSLAVEVLAHTSSRRFGLPQLSSVSDVLADIYIDPMRRVLVRRGYLVWCFTDDFRVACRSYDEALGALEATDEAARELGLVLNEMKSSTPGIDRYRASLTAVRDRERELFAMLEVEELNEPDPGEYGEERALDEQSERDSLLDEADFDDADLQPEAPNDEEVVSQAQLLAASKVVDLWVEEEEDEDTQRSERAQVTARILGRALRVFTLGGDPSALEHVASMLVYEPYLTPTIARYVRECGRFARRSTRNTLDDVCRSGIVSTWQAIWIAYIAGELPRRRGGEQLAHVGWLREQLRSPSAALRAEASLALARRRLTSANELLDVAAGLPSMHRPTALLGLAALGEEDIAMGAADSELDRLRIQWGLEKL